MKQLIDKNELMERRDKFKVSFFKTGNPYYFLIALELDKTIETKNQNDKNQELEEEQGLGL